MNRNSIDTNLSRRSFVLAAASLAAPARLSSTSVDFHASAESIVRQNDSAVQCDGRCPARPYIVVRSSPSDNGARSAPANDYALGPDSPSLWIENAATGAVVTNLTPEVDYVIVASVSNLGDGASYTLCVEFLAWTSTTSESGQPVNHYSLVSSRQGAALMPRSTQQFRSEAWTPAFGRGIKPGDVIVRAYDPWSDHYTDTGRWLYVKQDRHLGHKSYA